MSGMVGMLHEDFTRGNLPRVKVTQININESCKKSFSEPRLLINTRRALIKRGTWIVINFTSRRGDIKKIQQDAVTRFFGKKERKKREIYI